jgi:hypothetical protein
MYIYSDFKSKNSNNLLKEKNLNRKEHRKISIFQDDNLNKSINQLKESNLKKKNSLILLKKQKNQKNQ